MTAELDCPKKWGRVKFAVRGANERCPLSGTLDCEECKRAENPNPKERLPDFPRGTT